MCRAIQDTAKGGGVLGVVVFFSLAALGCGANDTRSSGAGERPGCVDRDGDEYGAGLSCVGADCDDQDPNVWDADVCVARCGEDPHSTGCRCTLRDNLEPEICYTGGDGTAGVGSCHAGMRACTERGEWSPCEGQVVPRAEACDFADDDCDGEVDEALRNECDNCDADCRTHCVGHGKDCAGFDVSEATGIVSCDEGGGCITLSGEAINLDVLWVANTYQNSVSLIDTDTRREVGRYYTGPRPWSHSPSRTSVDFDGAVVVGNRAFGLRATATKIFAGPHCPDRNGDGVITTSSGAEDILDWNDGDALGLGDDECIAWHVNAGCDADGPCGVTRAVAVQDRIGLDGVTLERVWLGMYNERKYYEHDRETGEVVDADGHSVGIVTPYGAAIDRDGNLWSAGLSNVIARLDTDDPDEFENVTMPFGTSNYGITVDEDGDVWTGGTFTRFRAREHLEGRCVGAACWDVIRGEHAWGLFGAGVASDGQGSVWLGTGGSYMYRVRMDDLDDVLAVRTNSSPRGMAMDFDGHMWGIGIAHCNAIVFDPEAPEAYETVMNDCPGMGGCWGGVNGCFVYPYSYSDMTGFQLVNASDPTGRYSHVFTGCDEESATTWTAIALDGLAPVGSHVSVGLRAGDDLVMLARKPWVDVGTVAPGESPADVTDLTERAYGAGHQGRYLEVQLRLVSDNRTSRPEVFSFGPQYSCDRVLQ